MRWSSVIGLFCKISYRSIGLFCKFSYRSLLQNILSWMMRLSSVLRCSPSVSMWCMCVCGAILCTTTLSTTSQQLWGVLSVHRYPLYSITFFTACQQLRDVLRQCRCMPSCISTCVCMWSIWVYYLPSSHELPSLWSVLSWPRFISCDENDGSPSVSACMFVYMFVCVYVEHLGVLWVGCN